MIKYYIFMFTFVLTLNGAMYDLLNVCVSFDKFQLYIMDLCIFYHVLCAYLLSGVWLFVTPWTITSQAPLSMVILQERILEWVAMPSSRGSSQPRDWTQAFCIAGGLFTSWTISEAQEYWSGYSIISPVNLCNPRIEPGSPALQADFFYCLSYQGSHYFIMCIY